MADERLEAKISRPSSPAQRSFLAVRRAVTAKARAWYIERGRGRDSRAFARQDRSAALAVSGGCCGGRGGLSGPPAGAVGDAWHNSQQASVVGSVLGR
eukprot:11215208-Lingulodinium_polyedra.AAC.1